MPKKLSVVSEPNPRRDYLEVLAKNKRTKVFHGEAAIGLKQSLDEIGVKCRARPIADGKGEFGQIIEVPAFLYIVDKS